MANLESLPVEIIEIIIDNFEYSIDLCAFSQVNHRQYSIASKELNRRICQDPLLPEDELDGSPLHSAARSGNEPCIRRMLQAGYRPDPRVDRVWDPVILAAQEGHTEIVKILLENGVDSNTTQPKGPNGMAFNPLVAALSNGHESVVRLLIEHGARLENENNEVWVEQPLHAAFRNGYPSLVRLLLENGCNPPKPDPVHINTRPAWTAALGSEWRGARNRVFYQRSGHDVPTIRMLVDTGIKPEFSGEGYPYHHRLLGALQKANLARFKYLCAHVAKLVIWPNANGEIPMWRGQQALSTISYVSGVNPEEAEWLLVLINIDDIMEAKDPRQLDGLINGVIMGGAEDMLRRFLKAYWEWESGRPTVKQGKKLTLWLELAAKEGHISLVKLLLDHGANPHGLSSLHPVDAAPICAAAKGRNLEIVNMLLDLGAKPQTPVHHYCFLSSAINWGRDSETGFKIVQSLVERNLIMLEETDVRQILVLAMEGGTEIFQLIQQHLGAAADLDDPFYTKPFFDALTNGNMPKIEAFLTAGFKLNPILHTTLRGLKGLVIDVAKMEKPLEIVESIVDLLLKYGVSPETPACQIIPSVIEIDEKLRFPNAVRILLKKGADPFARCTDTDLSPLELLGRYGGKERRDIAKALLDYFDDQKVPFSKVQSEIRQTASCTSDRQMARLLWRWYWPKVY
ncbi:unnamed protein product [Penicillium salamii]|uniref:F-box domain-containing protein n=1 Tax=Penicillium salamii TaxID=1612424 RepID=A0A9W4JHY5_9EURO|nr:unnamed protein product [Penicillium salamii]CAG8201035.1 unnamed protein product [Penicillium salamii]CAG8202333.1 unnamed protein product [Penicillium salamii]CAG8209929.1 unnamed protein product [Penicillium salamii]CAG8227508.1 unnamed protein product [Penicillium salamii]